MLGRPGHVRGAIATGGFSGLRSRNALRSTIHELQAEKRDSLERKEGLSVPIPAAIQAEHIREALGLLGDGYELDEEFGPSTTYDVLHEGVCYPPKKVIALAAELATGTPLSPRDFSGGEGAGATNPILRRHGFTVVDKAGNILTGGTVGGGPSGLRASLETVLDRYLDPSYPRTATRDHPIHGPLGAAVSALEASSPLRRRPEVAARYTIGNGMIPHVPWIALLHRDVTTTTTRGVYVVYLFAHDMSAVYLTFNQGVTDLEKEYGTWGKARAHAEERAATLRAFCGPALAAGFRTTKEIHLHPKSGTLGKKYEATTVCWKRYERGQVPSEANLLADVEAVLTSYDQYIVNVASSDGGGTMGGPDEDPKNVDRRPLQERFEALHQWLTASGYTFEPFQVAAYLTALRTKPFVLLAGISGTGKSKLPGLVSRVISGSEAFRRIPVRPDWTDSADLLGFQNLQGTFQPREFLLRAAAADQDRGRLHTVVLDEMNLARVEQYFAELLSLMEDAVRAEPIGFTSEQPLSPHAEAQLNELKLPPNLAIVGTVNMDETTHGFSRKVLDRAFTLEMSDVRLLPWQTLESDPEPPPPWSVTDLTPRARRLAHLTGLTKAESEVVDDAVGLLERLNRALRPAQLQMGYRVRDEVALFALAAEELRKGFRTLDGDKVDPLDLLVTMKVLPRIVGGSGAIRRVLRALLGWSMGVKALSDAEAREAVEAWVNKDRPAALGEAFPRSHARLCLMWERLEDEGFASYWL